MPQTITFDSLRPPCPHMDETHDQWRRSVRGFIDREVMPFVEDWETAGRIPRELYKKASEAGLLGIGYPTEYGGEGTDFDRFHGIVTSEELARIGAGGVSSALNPGSRISFRKAHRCTDSCVLWIEWLRVMFHF